MITLAACPSLNVSGDSLLEFPTCRLFLYRNRENQNREMGLSLPRGKRVFEVDMCLQEKSQLSQSTGVKTLSDLLEKELLQLEEEIRFQFQIDNPMVSQIGNFIWNSGGKRVRPMLVFLCSRLCGYFGPKDIGVAGAVEMVHVASLLHDDIIDGAEVRRGNPSANVRWGNHLPILVGDYLYSWACWKLSATGIPQIVGEVANAIMDMADGELSEMLNQGDIALAEEEYIKIIQKKTATLFSSCCRVGAILGNKSKEMEDKLAVYGMNIGIAFQLIDDILDYTSDEEKLGKPVGSDLKDRKMTLPMIHSLQKGSEKEKERVKEIFSNGNLVDENLNYCLELINKYNSFDYTLRLARKYADEARECLSVFDQSVYYDALNQISDYVINRST